MNPHRNRSKYHQMAGSRRQEFRARTRFSAAKGLMVLTPDGFGVILGDSNKGGQSRKFTIRLTDGRIRHYSRYELEDPIGDFTKVTRDEWEMRILGYYP